MASTPRAEPDPPSGGDAAPDAEAPRALVARLGDVVLAFPAALVDAVVRRGDVTPVPGAEPWLAGVTAVRGRVLPVADLRRRAGLAPENRGGDPRGGWLVVLDDGRRAAGLAGLRVLRVAAYAPEPDGSAGPRGVGPNAAGLPVRGVVRLQGDAARGADALPRTAVLVDAPALLDLVHDPPTDGD